MDLGERLSAWLKAKGKSPKELAEGVGVSVAAVYQWIGTGGSKTTPSLPNLERAVALLGLTMERFYGRVPKSGGRAA